MLDMHRPLGRDWYGRRATAAVQRGLRSLFHPDQIHSTSAKQASLLYPHHRHSDFIPYPRQPSGTFLLNRQT